GRYGDYGSRLTSKRRRQCGGQAGCIHASHPWQLGDRRPLGHDADWKHGCAGRHLAWGWLLRRCHGLRHSMDILGLTAAAICGALVMGAVILICLAWNNREGQEIDPEEVERVAILLWDGYKQVGKNGRDFKELHPNVRYAFRLASRAVLADLKK